MAVRRKSSSSKKSTASKAKSIRNSAIKAKTTARLASLRKKNKTSLRNTAANSRTRNILNSRSLTSSKDMANVSMRLFGVPYQFTDMVDPRVKNVSSDVGRNFVENILMEAPVCTVIPGEPSFMASSDKGRKISTAQALIQGASGDVSSVIRAFDGISDAEKKLYDFKPTYNSYMNYVNVLCRMGALFLDIGEDSDGIGKSNSQFQSFDWRNYKWNKRYNQSISTRIKRLRRSADGINDLSSAGETLSSLAKTANYVQFYIDSDVSSDESLQNSTTASTFKGMMDQGSGMAKEIAFMANSGGLDTKTLGEFTEGFTSALQGGVSQILGGNGISAAFSRIVNLGSETLKGHNLVIPDIYTNSDYNKGYSFTVHLKTPYGTRFGYYMDIFVPMMHLLALVMPRQETANSFSSPFLLKAYVNNTFTCNLGMATSISIQKVGDSFSVSGLPNEVDVTIQIADLYSDLMMSPSNEPTKFLQNSSLIEYIATNCGLDLTSPNLSLKWAKTMNVYINSIKDIPTNAIVPMQERLANFIRSNTDLISR